MSNTTQHLKPTTKKNPTLGTKFEDFLDSQLQDDDLRTMYLQDALDDYSIENDWQDLQLTLLDITRAKGITATAEQMGISRQSLSNMLNGESVPSATRFLKLLHALGYRLEVKPVEGGPSESG